MDSLYDKLGNGWLRGAGECASYSYWTPAHLEIRWLRVFVHLPRTASGLRTARPVGARSLNIHLNNVHGRQRTTVACMHRPPPPIHLLRAARVATAEMATPSPSIKSPLVFAQRSLSLYSFFRLCSSHLLSLPHQSHSLFQRPSFVKTCPSFILCENHTILYPIQQHIHCRARTLSSVVFTRSLLPQLISPSRTKTRYP
ncbi:uncharacterized protein EI97DRAFT_211460 [Westerdykella ornata]|uniref:Uncharacterized protein n=1 Tax=Westerdykella ornata TaxID=318751 RepID=A0A6A6J6Z5_WESOR|nr:uncharacterized protein EI97DRAFT_211460 [Westerdykella ornata]KAF2272340.1 hypothetical protein EI97DRAFT_211460 [Westerdykella ornata]